MRTLDAGPAGVRQPGAVVEVDEAEGAALVAGGFADVVETPKAAKSRKSAKAEDPKAEDPKAEETNAESTETGAAGEGGDA